MTRLLFERISRTVALAALLTALVVSWTRAGGSGRDAPQRVTLRIADSLVTDTGGAALAVLRTALVESVARRTAGHAMSDSLLLPLHALPAPSLSAAMGAMVTSGVPLRWQDSTEARGLAGSLVRAASPGAPMNVRVAAFPARALALRDAGGVLDSTGAASAVMSWRLRSAAAPVRVAQGRSLLTLRVPDSSRARRVLVMARPGWEGKFVVAALEEAGWLVDGTMVVSPTGRVTVGAPQRLDTARYAAVVVLDSMILDGAAVGRFVSRGGGLVLGGDALRAPALSPLRPARATELRGAIAGGLLTDTPRRGLEAWELALAKDAMVLEMDRGDHAHDEPALVARRIGAGRVVAMPYHESWRWRMQGSDEGMQQHRQWWHTAVTASVSASVAPVEASAGTRDLFPGEAAPYADLVARAGKADTVPVPTARIAQVSDERASRGDIPLPFRPSVLLLTALVALVAEWASRRLRGAR